MRAGGRVLYFIFDNFLQKTLGNSSNFSKIQNKKIILAPNKLGRVGMIIYQLTVWG